MIMPQKGDYIRVCWWPGRVMKSLQGTWTGKSTDKTGLIRLAGGRRCWISLPRVGSDRVTLEILRRREA